MTKQTIDLEKKPGRNTLMILGSVLTALLILALIGLAPRLSASQEFTYRAQDPVPLIVIANEGYVPLYDAKVVCFITDTIYGTNNSIEFAIVGNGSPTKKILKPNHHYKAPFSRGSVLVNMASSNISHTEIGVAIYYRPWPFTFLNRRKVFRFVGHNDGKILQWSRQSPSQMEMKFDKAVQSMNLKF